MKITVLVFILCGSIFAKADVLFIDLNNVELEIQVARKAAKDRGENLIVLPVDRDQYKDPVRAKLKSQLETLERSYYAVSNQNKREEIYKKMEEIFFKIDKLPPAKLYTAKKLKEEIEKVHGNISSVMISAHDGGGDFHGEFGHIKSTDFLNTLSEYSGRDNIRSLYLLGCESATVHTFGATWKAALPKASFIAGYEGTGYLRDNGMGHDFIRKTMAEEKNILASISMEEAQKKFRKVSPGAKDHGTAACVTLNNSTEPIYLSSVNDPKKFSQATGCPSDLSEKIIHFQKCVISEVSPCEMSEGKKILNLSSAKKCNYVLGKELDAVAKFRNQMYILESLNSVYSGLGKKYIFARLPEKLKNELKIVPDELTTYPQIKEKLLSVRDAYDKMFDYNSIKDLPMHELSKMADDKFYFDQAWLAVSNFDMSAARQLYNRSQNAGGEIRAQAFFKAIKSGEISESYQQRIDQLNAVLANCSDQLEKSNLISEIKFLEQYKKNEPVTKAGNELSI